MAHWFPSAACREAPLYQRKLSLQTAALLHHGNVKGRTLGLTVRPALCNGLGLGVEADALHAVLVGVSEGRALPPAKTVVRHGYRNGYINTDHAHVHPLSKFPCGTATAGKDCQTVAILVFLGLLNRALKRSSRST